MNGLIYFGLVTLFVLFLVIIFVLLSFCIVIVKQGTRKIVERFGVYKKTLNEGMHIIWWPFEKIATLPFDIIKDPDPSTTDYNNLVPGLRKHSYSSLYSDGAELKQLIKSDIKRQIKNYFYTEEEKEKCPSDDRFVRQFVKNNTGFTIDECASRIILKSNKLEALESLYAAIGVEPSESIIEQLSYHDSKSRSAVSQRKEQRTGDSNLLYNKKTTPGNRPNYIDLRERFVQIDVTQQINAKSDRFFTRDNVVLGIRPILFFNITDCFRYFYASSNPEDAMTYLAISTLRNLVATMTLTELFSSRDRINKVLRQTLDNATDNWGIKVNRVEIRDFDIDDDMVNAMNDVLTAENKKQAVILEAEGEARSIELKRAAEAEGYKRIKDSGIDNTVVRIRECEALEKLGDGQATKIFMPTNMGDSIVNSHILADAFDKKEEAKPVVKEEKVETAEEK